MWSRVRDWMACTKSYESKVRFLNLFFYLYILLFFIIKLYMYLVRKVQKNVKEKIGAVEMT